MSERRPAGQNGAPSTTSNTPDDHTALDTVGNTPVGDTRDWWAEARASLEKLAASGQAFSVYELSDSCPSEPPVPCLWGAVVGSALLAGRIVPVGSRASQRRTRRFVRTWRGVSA
ncbi:hypothetical protein ACTXG6_40395 [Pseudonocardia sp. Cha107L01]|uniref:hypothetical protein n=1 Tax=Pseudonocardia sp. Cha107L01 TaxID=3457576 RepID=UPI00403EE9F1